MKRLAACVMLAAILLAACARPAAPVSEGFAIYLLAEKLSPAEVARADLGALKLEDEPILSTEDIVAYASGTHQITLTPSAMEKLGQLKVPAGGAGIPFVVCVDKEPIYSGAFWSPLSSLSFDGVAIMLLPGVLPGAQLDYVRIEAGFVGERPDPRPDPRILQALERAGKLVDRATPVMLTCDFTDWEHGLFGTTLFVVGPQPHAAYVLIARENGQVRRVSQQEFAEARQRAH